MNKYATIFILVSLVMLFMIPDKFFVFTEKETDNILIVKDVDDGIRIVTAYNLVPEQTDDNPCTTAYWKNGKPVDICELAKEIRLCATRLYPLETKLEIENVGECLVVDRTAKKYSDRVDVVFPTIQEAKEFGIQKLLVKVK